LRWALTPPGWRRDWHVAVRVQATNAFVAFITGIPVSVRVNQKSPIKMAEINFLCVHKKLRSKRLAPTLIAEITRRVNLTNIWQAVYTAGILIPKPVSKTRYWHRNLNPPKLIDIGFSSIPRGYVNFKDPLEMTVKYYKTADKFASPGFRKMVKKDIPTVTEKLNSYLEKFTLHPEFSKKEFTHWFSTRDGVINSFVVEDPTTKEITDFGSFYTLPSTGQPINKYHASSCIFPGGYLISWKNGYLVRTDMIYMIETNMFAIPHTSKSGQVLLLKRNRLLAYSSEKSIGFTFLVIDCDNNTVIRQFDINLSASRIYIISNDIIFLQEDRLGYHSKGYGHLISITAEKVIKTISTLHNDSCMHQEADIDRINGVFIYKSLSTGGLITNHRPYKTIMAGYMLYDEYSVETEHMKTNLVTCGHFSDVSISMVT
jgi:hypothetical protein